MSKPSAGTAGVTVGSGVALGEGVDWSIGEAKADGGAEAETDGSTEPAAAGVGEGDAVESGAALQPTKQSVSRRPAKADRVCANCRRSLPAMPQ
jgi:hypothetical protein